MTDETKTPFDQNAEPPLNKKAQDENLVGIRAEPAPEVVPQEKYVYKKAISLEGFICLFLFAAFLVGLSLVMGFSNALNTIFNTAYELLTDVVWYLLALIVLMGAVSGLLNEFGVISIANKAFSPLMKPIYGMPGATSIAIFTAFMSDNPSILTLGADKNYARYFKKYQLAALTNIGTAFGMGLIVTVSVLSMNGPNGESYVLPVVISLFTLILVSILTTRLMIIKTKKVFGTEAEAVLQGKQKDGLDVLRYRQARQGSVFFRIYSSMLDGGASGVKIGLGIIPGVLIIATMVLILTNGKPASGVYTGAAGEGVGLIPLIGGWLMPVLKPLFGFTSPEAIAVPLTALGSAGAAISIIPDMVQSGLLTPGNVAVITSMCMFWSGYLSTHVSMMDTLNFRELTGWSILFHTIGGIAAGILSNLLYGLVSLLL